MLKLFRLITPYRGYIAIVLVLALAQSIGSLLLPRLMSDIVDKGIVSGNQRAILEIGAFVGGATIAAALGVRDSSQEKKLIAVEPGGSVKHKRLGTRNILRDLERNLARERVANMVTLIKGKSFKPETTSAVRQALGPDQVGLLILDADAAKRRDIDCYRDKFADGSWMVIDDIYGADANEKITPSRADVDALVAEGLLEPLGFYGWSTWVGRWRGDQPLQR